MVKKTASLSVDLDDLWVYLKMYGNPVWKEYPSYFSACIPIILDWLHQHHLTITFFAVGQDVVREENRKYWRQIVAAGHEIGNHSFNHEPWLIYDNKPKILEEILDTHNAIVRVCDRTPIGFRGPGFCHNLELLQCLKNLDYQYDTSVYPSLLGPLSRLYFLNRFAFSKEEKNQRRLLFGRFRDGFYSLKPFAWKLPGGALLEIPITTLPVFHLPFHASYLFGLAQYSPHLSLLYLKFALLLCRMFSLEPAFLLHPLDFLSKEEVPQLTFLPGMNLTQKQKLKWMNLWVRECQKHFDIVSCGEYARKIREGGAVKEVVPKYPSPSG